MAIVVDNSAGGDADLAAEVGALLRARGFDVEMRGSNPRAKYDTAVHLLTTGLAIRVPQGTERAVLTAIEEDVRAALLHRPSLRRRTRTVPVHQGEGARVLAWIDVFG
jgi:hypothetical protein